MPRLPVLWASGALLGVAAVLGGAGLLARQGPALPPQPAITIGLPSGTATPATPGPSTSTPAGVATASANPAPTSPGGPASTAPPPAATATSGPTPATPAVPGQHHGTSWAADPDEGGHGTRVAVPAPSHAG